MKSRKNSLTRLKEGLTDRRYFQLAHSLYTANDMTYTRASSLIKGNTSFGKHAMQISGEDDVNIAVDDSKWKVHKSNGRCNKYKKITSCIIMCEVNMITYNHIDLA